jgi:hypothetical protein
MFSAFVGEVANYSQIFTPLCCRKDIKAAYTYMTSVICNLKIGTAPKSETFEHRYEATSGKFHTMKPCFMHKII